MVSLSQTSYFVSFSVSTPDIWLIAAFHCGFGQRGPDGCSMQATAKLIKRGISEPHPLLPQSNADQTPKSGLLDLDVEVSLDVEAGGAWSLAGLRTLGRDRWRMKLRAESPVIPVDAPILPLTTHPSFPPPIPSIYTQSRKPMGGLGWTLWSGLFVKI